MGALTELGGKVALERQMGWMQPGTFVCQMPPLFSRRESGGQPGISSVGKALASLT